ncbi:MAG: hypothetical protein WCG80_04355 [Spirochaetales bacterium]
MEELKTLLSASRAALAAGQAPFTVAEEFFEAAVTPISKLRSQGTLPPEAEATILEAVQALMGWGGLLFAADRDATRKLDRILSWAKHLAGKSAARPELEQLFDNAYQDWHWHGW